MCTRVDTCINKLSLSKLSSSTPSLKNFWIRACINYLRWSFLLCIYCLLFIQHINFNISDLCPLQLKWYDDRLYMTLTAFFIPFIFISPMRKNSIKVHKCELCKNLMWVLILIPFFWLHVYKVIYSLTKPLCQMQHFLKFCQQLEIFIKLSLYNCENELHIGRSSTYS